MFGVLNLPEKCRTCDQAGTLQVLLLQAQLAEAKAALEKALAKLEALEENGDPLDSPRILKVSEDKPATRDAMLQH